MDLDPQLLDGLARATVKLIGKAPVKPDLESPATRTNGDLSALPSATRPSVRAH